jgi:hypothetical protein
MFQWAAKRTRALSHRTLSNCNYCIAWCSRDDERTTYDWSNWHDHDFTPAATEGGRSIRWRLWTASMQARTCIAGRRAPPPVVECNVRTAPALAMAREQPPGPRPAPKAARLASAARSFLCPCPCRRPPCARPRAAWPAGPACE